MNRRGWSFRFTYGLEVISKIAWICFLLGLPVTSFPYLPLELGGGTLVRPLSILPLLVLLTLVILPRLIVKRLPRTLLSFLPFVLVALSSTLLASLQGIEGAQGVTVTARMLRASGTLGLGAAFYLTVVLWPRNQEELRFSLRWMYIGFALSLLWGSLQAIYIVHFSAKWFNLLSAAQRFVSTRKLFNNRISGMTYEPNWFADQIAFVLLPWLLASVLTGKTVFPWRWRWLTVEGLLLAWSFAVLPFTFSRAGLFIMLALVLAGVLLFRPRERAALRSGRRIVLRRFGEVAVLLAVLTGAIYFVGTRNVFFSRLWDYWQRRPDRGTIQYLSGYLDYLGFGARFAYWQTAYRTYLEYPVLGVGLGNYAFYFEEKLPDVPLATMPEVLRLVVPEVGRNRLITSKNLYLRVLAETGILGAATFLAFLVAIFGCAVYLWLSTDREGKFWGIGSLLGMIAFGLVAFSFDSFALPNMWVVFGLITAAAWVWRKKPVADGLSLEQNPTVS